MIRLFCILFIKLEILRACPYPMKAVSNARGSLIYCNPNPQRFAPGSYYSTFATCEYPQLCLYRWLGMYTCCKHPIKTSPAPMRPLLHSHDSNGWRKENAKKLYVPLIKTKSSSSFSELHRMKNSNKSNDRKTYYQRKNGQLGRPPKGFKVEFVKSLNFTGKLGSPVSNVLLRPDTYQGNSSLDSISSSTPSSTTAWSSAQFDLPDLPRRTRPQTRTTIQFPTPAEIDWSAPRNSQREYTGFIIVKCIVLDQKPNKFDRFFSSKWRHRRIKRMNRQKIKYIPVRRSSFSKERLPLCPSHIRLGQNNVVEDRNNSTDLYYVRRRSLHSS